MVASPWRRFFHVARWNGHPAHTTTGAVSVSTSHCQLVNCSAGNMEMAMTGTDSATEPITRLRRASSSRSAGVCASSFDDVPAPAPSCAFGFGSVAP